MGGPSQNFCRGEFSLNGALILVLVFALLVLGLSVMGVANHASRVHNMATQLMRYIEVRGQVDAAVHGELARLEAVSGLDVDCAIEADYRPDGHTVQFGDVIEVTLTCEARFGIGGVVSVPVTLRSTVSGRSELYWK